MSDGEKTGFLSRMFGRGKSSTQTPHQPSEVERLREEVADDIRRAEEAEQAARDAREADTSENETEAGETEVPETEAPEIEPHAFVGDEAAPSDAPAPIEPSPAEPMPAGSTETAGTAQAAPAPPPSQPASPRRQGFFARLTQGLTKTSSSLTTGIGQVFTHRKLDAETLEELEDVLLQADLGVETSMRVAEAVGEGRYGREIAPDEVKRILATEVSAVLEPVARPMPLDPSLKPQIVLVVGVNGSGKTTTIGKLASKFTARGRTVMLAAGDTFRAAAVEQLKVWGERTGAPVVTRPHGADAASLAFDAVKAAKEAGTDVLMIDTAGRLQNKAELMAELEKVVRVIKKIEPRAPHTVLLVLDATVGQNAMNQVEVFKRTAGVTGLAMTKLDGTAKGGILVAIAAKHRLPIHFVGVGEGIDDLEPFDPDEFSQAIAGLSKA